MDLREVYARLDPVAPLNPGSSLYVQRPADVVGRLASELSMFSSPRHILFAGQRGSGKSTELARLEQAAARDDVIEPIRFSIQDYIKDIYAEFGLDDIVRALNSSAKDRLRDKYQRTPSPVIPSSSEIERTISTFSNVFRVPCFFVDDFDRVPQISAEKVLLRTLPVLGRIQCDIVLVVHLSVVHSSLAQSAREFMARVATLPNVVVHSLDGKPAAEGIEVMKQILFRRVPSDLVEEPVSDRVAELSGGVVGEMMWPMQTACASAVYKGKDRIGVEHVQEAAAERRRTYMRDLDSNDLEALRDVMRTGKIRDSEQRRRLLYTGALLEYENSSVWWGCHPILWPLFEKG